MANDYLLDKWRVLFKAIDVDNDGHVTLKDADIFVDRFIKLHGLDGKEATEVRRQVRSFWSTAFYLDEEREKITEEEFIAITTHLYNSDRAKYKDRVATNQVIISDVYDVNKDGYLSTEELVVTVKCHGLEDFDPNYVLVYPEVKPGLVDMAVFRESWVEFMTNPDRERNEKEIACLVSFNMAKKK